MWKLKLVLTWMVMASILACDQDDEQTKWKRTQPESVDNVNSPESGNETVSASPSSDAPATPPSKELQLKSADMIAQSIYATLGPRKTIKVEGNTTSDLINDFGKNFGGTQGLRLGELYADAPSTSYLLALTIVADHAAGICASRQTSDALCNCGTESAASSMIKRAIPQINLENPASKDLVKSFSSTCKSDPKGAVAALIGSLAFAARI